jgi:ribosome-associated toxin RatA of RatAB toxin-antitoxin module
MQEAGATGVLKASAVEIWAVVGNVSSVDAWHPDVASADLLSPEATGIGAKRRCHFYDGTSVIEEVVELDEGRRIRLRLSEFSVPMKRMEAEFLLAEDGDERTRVSFTVFYEMKYGILGRMMGATMVRARLAKMSGRVLAGLDQFVVSGETVGEGFDASVA